jgi:hypothetical protein
MLVGEFYMARRAEPRFERQASALPAGARSRTRKSGPGRLKGRVRNRGERHGRGKPGLFALYLVPIAVWGTLCGLEA